MAATVLADRQLSTKIHEKVITFGINGITTGDRQDTSIALPFNCQIIKWKVSTTTTMNCTFDIKNNGSAITGAVKPNLTAATFRAGSNMTGWTTALLENDIIMVSVDVKSSADKAILQLIVRI